MCLVSGEPSSGSPGLSLCCQASVHDECRDQLEDRCDYGQHRALIIPPERVVTRQGRSVASLRRKVISHVAPPPEAGSGDSASLEAGTRPLIVVGNIKSGNSDCAAILASFRRHLNPGQVVSLNENSMEDALEWCALTHPRQCTLLACGGDGTVR